MSVSHPLLLRASDPTYDSAAPRHLMLDEVRDLYNYRYLLRNLVRRNVTARYKRSLLGVIWTLLDPLMTMAVMAFVFSALFAQPVPRFPVFLLAGIIIWNFITQSSTQAIADLLYEGSLMTKVYMPRSVFAFAALGTGLVNLGFALVPLILIMALFKTPVGLGTLFVMPAIVIVSLFTLGIGLSLSALAVYFGDVLNIHRILMQLLMWASGVFYSLGMMPENLRPFVSIVPTFHLVALFREPLYSASLPPLGSIAYATGVSVLVAVFGFWFFMRLSDEFAYRV